MKIYITEAQFKKLLSITINEEVNSNPIDEIYFGIGEKAKSVIDYLYNEGVINYDDRHLSAMAKDASLINFKDICKCIRNNYADSLSDDEVMVLGDYLNVGSNPELEDQIIRAVKEYEEQAHKYFSSF